MRLDVCSALALVMLGGGLACGAPPPPAAPPPAASKPPPPAPPTPRCKASEPNDPSDAKSVMKQAGEEVKGCFLLGKATSAPSSVAIELSIHEDGSVASKKARADGAEPGQLSCVENVLSKLKFSKFCGDNVALRWNYALARLWRQCSPKDA